ncbi:uncharacterized protein I303_105468 [Kwoniella dejecticola CBS 10117]|uniref:Uncharacterized protein n=1 Tax=Kwoniella dejecticola CBS 10117 TaxID=1296121 RepID=A0A1A6A2F8_9TREE|nr:uncharacterized protein I303_05090 [Kwoniella dejecticola CBS 10117]OBR84233.1 hypothetical protein I303_05090 [Kwoniella dejecticola CBS 10117]
MVSNADNVEEEGATCGRTYQVTLNDSQCRPALFGLVDRFSKESNFRYCHPINGGYEISLYAIEQELSTAHVVEQTSPQATSLGQIQSEGDVRACRSSLETHILFATDQSMVFNGIGISGYEDTSLKNRACVDWMKTKQFAMKTDSDLSRSGEFAEGDRFAEEALQGLTVTLHNGQETVQKLEDVFFTVRGETVIYGGEADDAKSVQSEMAMLFMPVDIK